MRRHHRVPTILAIAIALSALDAASQSRFEYSIRGQILSPTAFFNDSFEVRLLRDSVQPVEQVLVRPLERFSFRGLTDGSYILAADVPGFKSVRERVIVSGASAEIPVTIILDLKDTPVARKPMDLFGDKGVVTVADLVDGSSRLHSDLRAADEELWQGHLERAEQSLKRIVDEAPEFYPAHISLGAVYQKKQQYRDAEAEYATARDLRPADAKPLIHLGGLYIEQADSSTNPGSVAVRTLLNDALAVLLDAVALQPDAGFAYYLLGLTYYKASLYEDSETNLIRSLELLPAFGSTRLALANLYVRLQEWPAALSQLDVYLDENPDAPDVPQIRKIRSQIQDSVNAEKSCGFEHKNCPAGAAE